MKILTVIQARLGSSRLPGKVLRPLGRGSVLSEMVRRVRASRHAGQVVVATTTDPQDDALVAHCEAHNLSVFRGHPTDLLDRHYQAMKAFRAEAVVKIPSDCPLIDPKAIDRVLGYFEINAAALDYVSNLHPQSYPDGNDVEVMTAAALERAWREATKPYEREHTTPYLWDNPERFRLGNVLWEKGIDLSRTHRWTLDYPEDYELIRAVYDALAPRDPSFDVDAIVRLVDSRPELKRLNAAHLGYAWYNGHAKELKTLSGKEGTA